MSRSSPNTRSTPSTFGYSSPAVSTPGGGGFGRNISATFGNSSFGNSSFGSGIVGGGGSGSGIISGGVGVGSAIGSVGGNAPGSTSPLPATTTTTTTATATPIPDRKKVSMSMQSGYRSPGFGNAPVGGYGTSGDPPLITPPFSIYPFLFLLKKIYCIELLYPLTNGDLSPPSFSLILLATSLP